MGEGDFRPPHSSETPGPIFMKLEIYNYFPHTTQHAEFQGPISTWVVWANSQCDAWKFVLFFVSSPRPQVAFLDTSQRSICHNASFSPRKCLLGLERLNFKFDPVFPPKKRKNWDFKLAVNGNCSRPNSGTVTHIMFKLGTRIEHPSGITWHDSKVKRSTVKVTT